MLENKFQGGEVEKNIFIKKFKHDILLVQICVDNIISGATNESLFNDLSYMMYKEFEMYMMGEIHYFPELQIQHSEEGTFLNQDEYFKEFLKRFNMDKSKEIDTPIATSFNLEKDKGGI